MPLFVKKHFVSLPSGDIPAIDRLAQATGFVQHHGQAAHVLGISPWGEEPYDALTFHSAMELFKAKHPRVLYVSFGETDEWGHDGRYDEYLTAAHRFDAYVKTLWETAQSLPEYRGTTTLILSTDHGRGLGAVDWKSHDKTVPNSDGIWIGVLGPDTVALGERSQVPDLQESQIAATLAAILGENYNADVAKAGRPIADVLPK